MTNFRRIESSGKLTRVASHEAPINDFGLLIAYVIPGFAALWGTTYLSPEAKALFSSLQGESATLGGFLYATVAAIAAGLIVSTIRWLVIDTLHHRTGVPRPIWDFSRLQANVAAYTVLLEMHYKYYQFYANSVISVAWIFIARRMALGWASPLSLLDAALIVLEVMLYLGSRDTASKYFRRMAQILPTVEQAQRAKSLRHQPRRRHL